ncbi:MAG: hypothetical protein LBD20_00845 [Spirochaetaceae bacterium]|nr:hypothetical protein [Spirochaetaceae bacterium]
MIDNGQQAAQAGGQAPAAGGNIAMHGSYSQILDFSQQSQGDDNEVVSFGGKPIRRGDYNKLQKSIMASVTATKEGEAPTKELTAAYGKAMNKVMSSPQVQALLSDGNTDWKTIGNQIREATVFILMLLWVITQNAFNYDQPEITNISFMRNT